MNCVACGEEAEYVPILDEYFCPECLLELLTDTLADSSLGDKFCISEKQ